MIHSVHGKLYLHIHFVVFAFELVFPWAMSICFCNFQLCWCATSRCQLSSVGHWQPAKEEVKHWVIAYPLPIAQETEENRQKKKRVKAKNHWIWDLRNLSSSFCENWMPSAYQHPICISRILQAAVLPPICWLLFHSHPPPTQLVYQDQIICHT